MKILLIVESPSKAKTIEKLLGSNYIVKSSFGHIRDLGKEGFGIDIENGFHPNYKMIDGKGKVVKELKDTASKVDKVLLAADDDREGEAIAWHVGAILKMNFKDNNRISFHEITKKALENAVSNPRKVDMAMVNSQQTRRILDRIVGFSLSPLLWSYIAPKLSAGRVQSVCLKLVIEKENSIEAFQNKKYFKTKGFFDHQLEGFLNKDFDTIESTQSFLKKAQESTFNIENIEKKKTEKSPPACFITSTIQQEAGTIYRMSSKSIMSNLQKLYEAGLITYHRTDNVNLSSEFIEKIENYVNTKYGAEYFKKRVYKSKVKCAQEAHEAIRPTNLQKKVLDDSFDEYQKKIYSLIWKRTVASQMSNAVYDSYTITIKVSKSKYKFECKFEKLLFEGYKKVYSEYVSKKDTENENIPKVMTDDNWIKALKKDQDISNKKIICTEKFQSPPGRYSEATLIKKMEKLGIGRPSTYASIIDTIMTREYVKKENVEGVKKNVTVFTLEANKISAKVEQVQLGAEKNKLVPTSIGKETTLFLDEHFKKLMDYSFTSELEGQLDEIANDKIVWNELLSDFYKEFEPKVSLLKSRESKSEAYQKKMDNRRNLGTNSKNEHVFAYVGKFGPVIQFVDAENDKKSYFQKCDEKYDVNTITLDEVEKMMESNKTGQLGVYEDKAVYLKKGKFGYYLEFDKKNYKILDDYDEHLTINDAIQCIIHKGKSNIHDFGEYIVKQGPYGPYILHKSKFYKINKDVDLEKMNKEMCIQIVKESNTQPKKVYKKK
jgi:DNA topoisomerase-1